MIFQPWTALRGAQDFTEEAAAQRGASEALRASRAALRSEAVELGKTCGAPGGIWDGMVSEEDFWMIFNDCP